MPQTRKASRNSQLKELNSLKIKLSELIGEANSLRANYSDKKTGTYSIWNAFGFFPANVKNESRIALIGKIEDAAKAVKDSFSKMTFKDTPSDLELNDQVGQLTKLYDTLLGAIVTHKQELFDLTNGYLIAPGNSELYKALESILADKQADISSATVEYQNWLAHSESTPSVTV